MITIQGFAKLCGCSAQTLRYYDRIGLLIPARVDPWTGYRYYEEEQALQFVKIKSLQQADFSIDEIKPLLKEDGGRLQEAFERKITEQEEKLERIRKIQQSYLKEKMEMEKTICLFADFIEGRTDNPKLWEEFGLDAAKGTQTAAKAHELLADWLAQIRSMSGEIARQTDSQEFDKMKTVMEILSEKSQIDRSSLIVTVAAGDKKEEEIPSDAEKVFERDGWAHVSDWIERLPALDGSKQYYFHFCVQENSPVNDPGFPTTLLAVMASKYDVLKSGIACSVSRSEDGLNHICLLQK